MLVGEKREAIIELYSYVLTVVRSDQVDAPATRVVTSKSATCGDFRPMLCARFSMDEQKSYVFHYREEKLTGSPLEDSKTLEEGMVEDLHKVCPLTIF